MPDERRQFRVLYRDFLFRMVDLELLSAGGKIGNLLGQFAAMLTAFIFHAHSDLNDEPALAGTVQ